MSKGSRKIIDGTQIKNIVDKYASGVHDVMICSPFLTKGGILPLLDRFRQKEKVRLDVISRFNEIDCLSGATDPEVFAHLFKLTRFKKWDIRIWLVDSLHTKTIVLGKKAAIIGSANITVGGLENNLELGVLQTGIPVETIRHHLEGYKETGIELTHDALETKMARLKSQRNDELKRIIEGLKKQFKDRQSPGLLPFTKPRTDSVDYSTHVFELLEYMGDTVLATDVLLSWLHDRAIADEPKMSLQRIYFLEDLGLIEEVSFGWRRTERGKALASSINQRRSLYFRLRNRWGKDFEKLEDYLHKRAKKNLTFASSDMIRVDQFKKEKVKPQSLRNYWDIRLRWLESVGVVTKAPIGGKLKKYLVSEKGLRDCCCKW
jgi:HKD family nuclease